MPVDINDPAVLAQARAISEEQGIPMDYALQTVLANAPGSTPQQFQNWLRMPGPYSKDNLPPDDGVPFNLGPESLNGGLVGAPGADMGVDPMAGSGNPLLSDGKEGYGHFVDNSLDAGLDRALEKKHADEAAADQKMADQMNVLGEARQRDTDKSVELGMLPQQGYANLVEQDPDFVGHRVEQVASPTADDPDRTVPVTRVHGGKQMTHSPEDMARLEEMGLTTNALGGTPAYDYVEAVDAEGNTTFVNPTLMGKGEESGMLTPHQQQQLETRMNRMRDRRGYSEETQYTPYRKMDGSMGLRIDPNSPEVRQKRRDQMADEANRKQLVQARGMLAGVSPTQNMVNAQMLLMGENLPGGVGMSDEYRKGMMAQMFPEQQATARALAEQETERYRAEQAALAARERGAADVDIAGIDAGAKTSIAETEAGAATSVATITTDAATQQALARNSSNETIAETQARNAETLANIQATTDITMQKEALANELLITEKEIELSRELGDAEREQNAQQHKERILVAQGDIDVRMKQVDVDKKLGKKSLAIEEKKADTDATRAGTEGKLAEAQISAAEAEQLRNVAEANMAKFSLDQQQSTEITKIISKFTGPNWWNTSLTRDERRTAAAQVRDIFKSSRPGMTTAEALRIVDEYNGANLPNRGSTPLIPGQGRSPVLPGTNIPVS